LQFFDDVVLNHDVIPTRKGLNKKLL
jgi:hypothetical protein